MQVPADSMVTVAPLTEHTVLLGLLNTIGLPAAPLLEDADTTKVPPEVKLRGPGLAPNVMIGVVSPAACMTMLWVTSSAAE